MVIRQHAVEKKRDDLPPKLEDPLSRRKRRKTRTNCSGGLPPICSGCRKIRDDAGNWRHAKAYVSMHSEVDFSNTICIRPAEK